MSDIVPDTSQNRTSLSFVAVSPPLPCVDAVAGPGFVHALSPDCLIIRLARPGDAPQISTELTVSLGDGRIFSFQVTLGASVAMGDGQHEACVADDAGRTRLADLITLVRKSQHIAICATMDVEARDRDSGFSGLTLVPKALPEMAWEELDTSTQFLGRAFPLPLMITGMTGGLTRGAEINRRLARAALRFGIPMGVGSQRVALENPEHAGIFRIKHDVPGVFLIANVGIAQLRGKGGLDLCLRAIDMIDADALAIHVNVLQEVIQVEGDRDFRGLLAGVAAVARRLSVPVLVKEVGGGIDPETARRLVEAGVCAIDCGGKGGTSWSYIEGMRAKSPVTRAVAETFRDWGIPTAVAVATLREALPTLELAATGGIRDGLMVAKAVGLGARLCGIGLPLLRAALSSEDEPVTVLETLATGLRTAMMACGARRLDDLGQRLHVSRAFRELAERHVHPTGVGR